MVIAGDNNINNDIDQDDDIDPTLPLFMQEKLKRQKLLAKNKSKIENSDQVDGINDQNRGQDDDVDPSLPLFMQEKLRKQKLREKANKNVSNPQSNDENAPIDDIDPTLPLFMQEKLRRQRQRGQDGSKYTQNVSSNNDNKDQNDKIDKIDGFRHLLKPRQNKNDETIKVGVKFNDGDLDGLDNDGGWVEEDSEDDIDPNLPPFMREKLQKQREKERTAMKNQSNKALNEAKLEIGQNGSGGGDDDIDSSLPLFMQEKLKKQRQNQQFGQKTGPGRGNNDKNNVNKFESQLPPFMKTKMEQNQAPNDTPNDTQNDYSQTNRDTSRENSPKLVADNTNNQTTPEYTPGVDFFELDDTLSPEDLEQMRYFQNLVNKRQEFRALPYDEQLKVRKEEEQRQNETFTPHIEQQTTNSPANKNITSSHQPIIQTSGTAYTPRQRANIGANTTEQVDDSFSTSSSQFENAESYHSYHSYHSSHANSIHGGGSVHSNAISAPYHHYGGKNEQNQRQTQAQVNKSHQLSKPSYGIGEDKSLHSPNKSATTGQQQQQQKQHNPPNKDEHLDKVVPLANITDTSSIAPSDDNSSVFLSLGGSQ